MIQNTAPKTERPLGVRLAEITGKVAPIVATGTNQFDRNKKAMSVQDVEEALRPLLAEAGVVTNWSVTNALQLDSGQKLWQLNFHVTVYSSDDAADKIESDWMDVGTSPTAAASFAVKGYYRRLFHLADADDELAATPQVKPKTVRQAVDQIAQAYGDPAPQAQGATSPSPSQGSEADPPLASTETGELDLTDLFELAHTLSEPRTNVVVTNRVSKVGVAVTRRELILAHARDHGVACDHVSQLAGLKV